MSDRPQWNAASTAGLVLGVLSAIPYLSYINCLLCAWVWVGGILAIYLYRRNGGQTPLTKKKAAKIGALTGAIGGVVCTLLTYAIADINSMAMTLNEMGLNYGGDFIGLARDFNFFVSCLSLLLLPPIYSGFGALGGLIGANIFKAPSS